MKAIPKKEKRTHHTKETLQLTLNIKITQTTTKKHYTYANIITSNCGCGSWKKASEWYRKRKQLPERDIWETESRQAGGTNWSEKESKAIAAPTPYDALKSPPLYPS